MVDKKENNTFKYLSIILIVVVIVLAALFIHSLSDSQNYQSQSYTTSLSSGLSTISSPTTSIPGSPTTSLSSQALVEGGAIWINYNCMNYEWQCGISANIEMLNNTDTSGHTNFGGTAGQISFSYQNATGELYIETPFSVPIDTPFTVTLFTNGGTIKSVNINSPYAIVSSNPNLPTNSKNVTLTIEGLQQTYNPLIVSLNMTG
jgi:hypothetical protein